MTSRILRVLRRPPIQSLLLPSSRIWRAAPAAAWALLIFVLSSIPGDRYPEVRIVQFDKVVHFLLYLPLGLGLGRAFPPAAGEPRGAGRGVWAPVLLGTLYGASDELHQLLVPNRSCTLSDWIIDVLAVATGVLLWRAIERAVSGGETEVPAQARSESA